MPRQEVRGEGAGVLLDEAKGDSEGKRIPPRDVTAIISPWETPEGVGACARDRGQTGMVTSAPNLSPLEQLT